MHYELSVDGKHIHCIFEGVVMDGNLQGNITKSFSIHLYLVLCPKQYYLRLCVDKLGKEIQNSSSNSVDFIYSQI